MYLKHRLFSVKIRYDDLIDVSLFLDPKQSSEV